MKLLEKLKSIKSIKPVETLKKLKQLDPAKTLNKVKSINPIKTLKKPMQIVVDPAKLAAQKTPSAKTMQFSAEDYYKFHSKESNLKLTGKFGHLILWVTAFFLIAIFIWAKFAVLDEVTRAQGKVVPSKKTQIVQNLEGGIVSEIAVHEGEVVNKNQLLMKIENARFKNGYRSGRLKAASLQIKIERLEAEIHNEMFHPSDGAKALVPDLVRTELSLYHSKKEQFNVMMHEKHLIAKEINMTRPLIKSGAVSEVEVLRLERQLNDVSNRIASFRSHALQELNDVKSNLANLQEHNLTIKDQLERTEVRSPVHGVVKQIYVTTLGGVVKPGMPLMEVVPTGDTLLIEARVKPNDIGFLHSGQRAMVKISAYDFSIYGGLEAEVEHISADTTTDRKGNSFYEVWVRTDKNYLKRSGKNGEKLAIIPGMQATVEILTGQKSVLNYLLKPIMKAKYSAMRER